MNNTDKSTFNSSESMPLILGAGIGGNRIIINLWWQGEKERT